MRFRKRLSAAILAIVMMASSIQIPGGGVSYAAELAGDSITGGQDASTLTAEETENAVTPGSDEGAATDGGNLTDNEDPTGDDSQTGDDDPTGDDSQTGDDNLTGDDSQAGDDDPAGDDSQTEDGNDPEETDAGQVSGNDLVEPELPVDTEKAVTEDIRIVEAEIEGAYQFGGAPSGRGRIAAFSVSAYDDSVEDYVYQQMLKREEEIDISTYGVTKADADNLISGVLNEHPDLYFVNNGIRYSSQEGSNDVICLYVTYNTSYDDAAFNENTNAALACVNDGMSDLEKAAALHDWLAINAVYDYDNYKAGTASDAAYTAYGALVDGIAVCNGYALAYKYLLNQLGIECYMVISESLNHAWNMVKLDGEYYHVDVTWDDPVQDMVGVAYHDNLFHSDTDFGSHKDWVVTSGSDTVDYKATDTKYEEAFWVDFSSPLVFYGSDCYYIQNKTGKVKKGDFSSATDTGTVIADIGTHWKMWYNNVDFDINSATYSGLYMINDRLFYNDWDSIYSIKPDGTDKKTEFTPEKEGRDQICYSAYSRGKVVYALQEASQNHKSKQNVLIAKINGIGGYEPPEVEDYTISYELDGGTNDPDNPVKYNSGTETIILKAAVKDGFLFKGWYKDAKFKEQVTLIPQGSTGDITLYAKWKEIRRLDADNPEYTYSALGGRKVSSAANGRPKLLVLFAAESSTYSNWMNRALSEHIKDFDGVDICAICYSSDEQAVTAYKEQYGCDGITYCYDTFYKNSSGKDVSNNYGQMMKYIKILNPDAKGLTFPVMVHIDANNRVQHVVNGSDQSWTEVLEDLRDYCGYGKYLIRYELNGGKNNSENPYTYTEDTDTIILKAPVNGTNQFDGWYTDPEFTPGQRVTEIPKGSSGDITLYAKWGKRRDGLGLDNLDRTFKAVDDTTFSSAAENGRPRILVFFSARCLNSAYTMENIMNAKEELEGVDICKIECVGASKDDVTIIQEGCGFEENTVSYDTGSGNANAMYAYLSAAKITEWPVEFPVICYIDSNNYLQWVTMDKRDATADDIKANLKKYCNYPPEPEGIYHITYELDGGKNHKDNPDTYTAETEDIVLKDASKIKFIFEGWYKDAEFKEQVKTIPKGSTGDITLYAKWRENANGGLGIDNLDQTYKGLDGKTLSSAADGKPKMLVFFMKDNAGSQNTVKNITEIIDSLDGIDIYAVEMGMASRWDVTTFKNTYGCDEITFAYDDWSDQSGKAKEYMEAAELSGMYTPVICYIDKDNKLQWVTMREQTGDEILENLKKYCNYPLQEQGTYRITYELDGGTNDSANPASYTSVTETITLEDAVKEGYTFEGWYKDAEFNEQVTQIVKGSTGGITLYAKWSLAEFIISIKRPDRTTYKVGEELDVTGGKVILTNRLDESLKEEKDMEHGMTAGFDSSKPGICTVTVTCDGYKGRFDTLIVAEPEVTVKRGQKLANVALPKNEYGTYTWADEVELAEEMNEVGVHAYRAVFTPKDTEKFQTLTDLQIRVRVANALENDCVRMEFLDGPYTYRGEQIKPKVKVMYIDGEGEEVTLTEGQDYELDYDENLTEYGVVHVTGINDYTGTVSVDFDIGLAKRTIRALDKVILVGSEIPTEFEYEIVGGLYEGDELFKPLHFECDITSTAEEGEYDIRVSGADVGSLLYVFRYEKGTLYVVSEAATCKVTFDVQGHGTAPKAIAGIKAGDTIDSPKEPTAEGYRFDGWYKDTACTKAWDFETDTVQSDLTLYAKWLSIGSDGEFAVQEIADVYYTGKAQKPAVSVYDENTLLKAGKDYTIKYYNNTNANAGGVLKGEEFNKALPYVEITGKGNYKESVKINFNILQASIGNGSPAAGVTLKVNEQLVKANKAQKPFGSLKYGRNLKEGTDYELELQAFFASDGSGKPVTETKPYSDAKVPANYTGEFWLTVKGKGNYTGSIGRTVYVADKAHLMKNVKITLGKDLKNIPYTGSEIELKAAQKAKPANDEFVVTYGKTLLNPGVDYYVDYNNNVGVGKAELVVIGMNGYSGKKTATFNIKGKTFANGTVEVTGLVDQAYTGKAVVQNKNAVLKWKADGSELVYGTDYTISYSKNINKGTATITFTGKAEAGYSGKISKKFKITAADIADINKVTRSESMNAITLPYTKAGVKPVDEIILTNERGTRLCNGKDYTLAYKNNKAVANATAEKAPTVTVKGKGNYSGSFEVKFTIERADLQAGLRGGNITVECAQTAYNDKKKSDYEYKPAVTVKDGKTKLKAGTDYEISYVRSKQSDFEGYLEGQKQGWSMPDEGRPMAVITAKEGSAYTLQGEIEVPLQIYTEKLTRTKLDVKIDSAVYTGGQVRPKVTVTYKGEGSNIPLTEGTDYTLIYGANTASGKNKGSVTIKGLAPKYGGSVAYKFEIIRKDLKYWFAPVIDEK